VAVMIGEEVTSLEPVELIGINDDPRTGAPGLKTLSEQANKPLGGPRIRQLADMGVEWMETVAKRLGISEKEVKRRLLARDPSLVDESGALVGIAHDIQESIVRVRPSGARSRPQAFPLLGEQPTQRGWGFDIRLARMFLAQPFYGAGNPQFGEGYVPPAEEESD